MARPCCEVDGFALEAAWPDGEDAVLMSYLLSGVPGDKITKLIDDAFAALNPGGVLMIHDFIVEPDRKGPTLAALWQLQHMAFTPDARSISTADLSVALKKAGFEVTHNYDLIPGMTKLIVGKKTG